MPKEIQEVVNSYMLISKEEFSTLIESGVPEGFSIQIEQVGGSGLHGPKMKLSDKSYLKVTLVDESKKSAFDQIREFERQNHDLVTEEMPNGVVVIKNRGE